MSHEIIKKIRIAENKVFLTSASNNVFPRCFKEWECTTLTEVLQTEGEKALDIAILKDYESGTFQEGNPNKYSNAIKRFEGSEEYTKYSWRLSDYEENCPIREARKSKEFEDILYKHLFTQDQPLLLLNTLYPSQVYVSKVTKTQVKYTKNIQEAKVFKFKKEVSELTNMFNFLQPINQ